MSANISIKMPGAISREDRLVAALSHAGMLMPLVGLAVPITVLISQWKRSPYLKFQAMQALVFQIIGVIVPLIFQVCYVGLYFAMIASAFIIPLLAGATPFGSPVTVETDMPVITQFVIMVGSFLLLMLVFMTLGVLQLISIPLFALLALWAAGLTLTRRPCRYPLLGHLIARWMGPDIVV